LNILLFPWKSTCKSLRLLDLSSNGIGDCGAELSKILLKFPNLEELRLARNKLSDVTFENLDLSKLLCLNISQNLHIGSMGLENIRYCLRDAPMLHTLDAAQITTSADIFTPFTKLFTEISVQDIKNVKICKNNIQNEHILDNLDELCLFSQIANLNLSHNRAINRDTVSKILEKIESLKEITLHGTAVSDTDHFEQQFCNKITLK